MLKKILLQLCLVATFSSVAQQIIWEEDFAQGIPVEWNQDDISGGSAEWTYCFQQGSTATAKCPRIWDDGQNDQAAFESTSASNGFLVFDSDYYSLDTGQDHDVLIVTDFIDINGQTEVWLKLEYQIGVYLNPTNNNAFLEIITFSQEQKRYNIKPIILGDNPYPEFIRWSRNPEMLFINITDFVAGEESIKIRWRWKGNSEYFWAIDDVVLYDGNPMHFFLPDNDIEITEFLSVPPAIKTPITQLDPFGFFGDIINRGHETKDSVLFNGVVSQNGMQIFKDSIVVKDLAPNAIRQNLLFQKMNEAIQSIGFYNGIYNIVNPGDETPENNRFNFTFEITDSIFAKEDDVNDYARPPNFRWGNGVPHDWAWGNVFFLPNGSQVEAAGISFTFKPENQGFDFEEIAGTNINVLLYKWRDTGGPNGSPNPDGVIQVDERTVVAFGDYLVTGEEMPLEYVYQPFEAVDLLTLEDNTHYIATVKFNAQFTAQDIKIGAYVGTRYGSTLQRSQIINEPRYHSVLAIIDGNDLEFDMLGFGFDITPTIRLHIRDKSVSNKSITQTLNKVELIPNPVKDIVSIQLDGQQNNLKPTQVKIFNELGQLVQIEDWPIGNNQSIQLTIDEGLPNGVYQLIIESDGVLIAREKLVKQ